MFILVIKSYNSQIFMLILSMKKVMMQYVISHFVVEEKMESQKTPKMGHSIGEPLLNVICPGELCKI